MRMSDRFPPIPRNLRWKYVGQRIPTREGLRHVRGLGRFVDDLRMPGQAYAVLVRSEVPHARIRSISVERALRVPGVIGVFTGEDIARVQQPFPQLVPPPASEVVDYAMAYRKVRYQGEPVAAVVAESLAAAHDAAELVEVDYEPLKAITDPWKAIEEKEVLVHENIGTNVAAKVDYEYGDYEAAKARADVVVRRELVFHRFSSTPLEPNAVLAHYDGSTDSYLIYCNNQMPVFLSPSILRALNATADRVRIVTPDIGGGFGVKIINYTYMVLTALLSKLTRRPVKWVETRREHMMASSHGADRHFKVEAAFSRSGELLGIKALTVDDIGAYARHEPAGLTVWAQVAPGATRLRNLSMTMYAVFTNKCPAGPNRGFSRAPHQFMIERVLNAGARELGIDQVEIRRRNYVTKEEQPYVTLNGCVYDGGDYVGALLKAAEALGYERWRAEKERARREGRLIGIGFACTLDSGSPNMGQVKMMNPRVPNVGGSEAATVTVTFDGKVHVKLGSVPQGQSHETVAAQIVADVLGVPVEDVTVARGFDSHSHPYTIHSGTYGSRFAGFGTAAVLGAALKVREKVVRFAAKLLECSPEDVVLEDGKAYVAGSPDRYVTLRRIARSAYSNVEEAGELGLGLSETFVYAPEMRSPDERKMANLALTYSYQVHGVVVEVDKETGVVKVLDYVIVDDAGRVINPLVLEGQLHGAALHGLAAVLYESLEYDESGQLLTSSFVDYLCPTALEAPEFRTYSIETLSTSSPLGSRGVGEGCGTPIPALVNAIEDALSDGGVWLVSSHVKPEELLRLIRRAEVVKA